MKKKILLIEFIMLYATIAFVRSGNMKYTFRKFNMMYASLKLVKGDYYRTKEARKAIKYILLHPSFLFKKKRVESKHGSVLKAVNVITNYPYIDKLYFSVVK